MFPSILQLTILNMLSVPLEKPASHKRLVIKRPSRHRKCSSLATLIWVLARCSLISLDTAVPQVLPLGSSVMLLEPTTFLSIKPGILSSPGSSVLLGCGWLQAGPRQGPGRLDQAVGLPGGREHLIPLFLPYPTWIFPGEIKGCQTLILSQGWTRSAAFILPHPVMWVTSEKGCMSSKELLIPTLGSGHRVYKWKYMVFQKPRGRKHHGMFNLMPLL